VLTILPKKIDEQRAVHAFVPTCLWLACGRTRKCQAHGYQPVGCTRLAKRQSPGALDGYLHAEGARLDDAGEE